MFGKLSASIFLIVFAAVGPVVGQTSSGDLLPFATFDQASEAVLNDPHDLVIGPDNRIYVADKFANRIAIMDKETLKLVDSFGESDLASRRPGRLFARHEWVGGDCTQRAGSVQC